MPADAVPAKTFVLIALVFLALVVVTVFWGEGGEGAGDGAPEPRLARIQIAGDGQAIEISAETLASADDVEAVMLSRAGLLTSGARNERRATAVELANIANDAAGRDRLAQLRKPVLASLRAALLRGLNDSDAMVSHSCRKALVGLWRVSSSAAGDRYLRQGLAAFEAGHMDAALAVFRKVNESAAAPPDLYRLEAEVYLAAGRPDEALKACQRALDAEPSHFLALYAAARAFVQKGQYEKADNALKLALAVYNAFPEARQLRTEVAAHLGESAP